MTNTQTTIIIRWRYPVEHQVVEDTHKGEKYFKSIYRRAGDEERIEIMDDRGEYVDMKLEDDSIAYHIEKILFVEITGEESRLWK